MNMTTYTNTPIDVHNQAGVLVTTSRNIAAVFEKEHKNVLRDIAAIIENNPDKDFGRLNFELSSYRNEQNKEQPEYLLTRDGTMLLIMGYTGEKALALKTAYIKRFNEMEAMLRDVGSSTLTLERLINIARMILEPAGITGNQLTISLDNLIKAKTGESMLALTNTQLVAPEQKQLLTPTEIGKPLGLSAIKVNKKLEEMGLQYKTEAGWQPTDLGLKRGAVLLDTGKRHSNGTPVRQLKWPCDIL